MNEEGGDGKWQWQSKSLGIQIGTVSHVLVIRLCNVKLTILSTNHLSVFYLIIQTYSKKNKSTIKFIIKRFNLTALQLHVNSHQTESSGKIWFLNLMVNTMYTSHSLKWFRHKYCTYYIYKSTFFPLWCGWLFLNSFPGVVRWIRPSSGTFQNLVYAQYVLMLYQNMYIQLLQSILTTIGGAEE